MRKNLKTINLVLIFVLFIMFSFIFWKEYFDFQRNQFSIEKSIIDTKKYAKNFSLTDIKDLKSTAIYHTPYKNLINKIIEDINSSKEKIYLEVYIFTEKRILNAIKNAKKRGIEIKVVLEKNPYMTANINNKAFSELKKADIDVVWSSSENFSLNHAKFFIIDDTAIISTWNITYSSFKYNRDFFVFLKNPNIVQNLQNIFLADFKWEKREFYDENLVISPNYAREKIEKLLLSAKSEIQIYMQYLKDKKINTILSKLQKSWIDIKIIINKQNIKDKEISELKKLWIQIKSLEKIKMHSKVIVVDKKYMFVWSENFSSYSLDKNREVWVIVKEKELIDKVLEVFTLDWRDEE